MPVSQIWTRRRMAHNWYGKIEAKNGTKSLTTMHNRSLSLKYWRENPRFVVNRRRRRRWRRLRHRRRDCEYVQLKIVSYDLRANRNAVQKKKIQWKLKIRSPISLRTFCCCLSVDVLPSCVYVYVHKQLFDSNEYNFSQSETVCARWTCDGNYWTTVTITHDLSERVQLTIVYC